MIEVEQILEGIGIRVTQGQRWVLLATASMVHEPFLDQRHERRMVAQRMRDVVLLRKRRYDDERDSKSVLVEIRTRSRIRPRGCEARARLQGVSHAFGAVGPRTAFFARRGVGEIRALPGRNSVWGTLSMLSHARRRDVIVATAMLVIRDDYARIAPALAVPNGGHVLCDEILPPPDVVGRRLVTLLRWMDDTEVGVDVRHIRKVARRQVGRELRDGCQMIGEEGTKIRGCRQVGIVVHP